MSFKSFDLDALVEDLAPASLTFDVELPTKAVEVILHFRSPKDYAELQDFNEAALAWSKTIPKKANTLAGMTEEWKDWGPFLPLSPKQIGAIFTIAQLSTGWTVKHPEVRDEAGVTVSPEKIEKNAKLSYLDAAKLCRAAWTVDYLIKAIDKESKSMNSLWSAAALAKNDLRQTSGSGSSSPSAGTSTEKPQKPSRTRSVKVSPS